MIRVEAPVKGYEGEVAGVRFEDGVADVDESNRAALAYFRRQGYQVGDREPQEQAAEPPDPREVGTDGDGITVTGTRLRDAAVDPRPEDFLPPTNAGDANPHGPAVVSPGLHGIETGPIAPGVVPQDPRAQEAKETALATAVFVDQQPVQQATAEAAKDEPAPSSDVPSRRSSTDTWRTYATGGAPEADRLDPQVARGMTRDELAEHYLGPKEG